MPLSVIKPLSVLTCPGRLHRPCIDGPCSGGGQGRSRRPSIVMEQTLSKVEKEIIRKLNHAFYYSAAKVPKNTTYREFIAGMSKVLQFITEMGMPAGGYVARMGFIMA